MNMRYLALATALTAALATPLTHGFGLGGLNVLKSTSGSGNVEQDVSTFLTKLNVANHLLNKSGHQLIMALASKEKQAEFEKRLKALEGVADPKEKNALIAQLQADQAAEIQQLAQNEKVKADLKNASDEKKKNVANASFNYILGMFQAKDLLPIGNTIVQGVASNPLMVVKVLPVKDSIGSISSLVGNMGKSTGSLVDMMKAANIKPVMPTAANEPAKDVTTI
jgi:hypothetical protein